jgi:hypothetical protein
MQTSNADSHLGGTTNKGQHMATVFGALLDFCIYFLMVTAIAAMCTKRHDRRLLLQLVVAAAIMTAGSLYIQLTDPHSPIKGGKQFIEDVFR